MLRVQHNHLYNDKKLWIKAVFYSTLYRNIMASTKIEKPSLTCRTKRHAACLVLLVKRMGVCVCKVRLPERFAHFDSPSGPGWLLISHQWPMLHTLTLRFVGEWSTRCFTPQWSDKVGPTQVILLLLTAARVQRWWAHTSYQQTTQQKVLP